MSRPSKNKDEPAQTVFSDSHDILMNAPLGIITTTPDGQLLSANPAMARMFGYKSPDELIESVRGITSQLYADSSDREELMRILNENGEVLNYECRGICRDGSMVWVSINANKVGDESGNIYFQSFITDISERKQAESEINEAENRFRLMFTNAPMPYQSLDEQGNFLDVNQAFLDVLGYSREELIGRNFGDILHHDWRDHFKENFPKFKAVGEILGVEFEMVKKDGSTIFVYFNGKIQRDHQGRFLRTYCIFQDMTELKRIKGDLQRQTALISSLLDSIPDIIFVKDINGVYLGCNTEFSRHVGKSKKDIIGGTDYDLYPKDKADFFITNDKIMLEQGRPRHNEEWISYPDGREILLDTLKTPYRDIQGNILGVIGICRDITDRKQTEDELRLQSLVLDQIEDRVTVTDLSGKITYVNQAEIDSLGYTREEILSQSTEIYGEDPQHGATQREIFETTIRDGHWRGEVVNYAKDGNERILDCRTQVVRDEKGQPVALCGISTDITERIQTQEELRKSEEQKSYILEVIPDIIIKTNYEGKCLDIIASSEEKLYRPKDELMGKKIPNILPAKQASLFMETIHKAIQTKSLQSVEYELLVSSGKHWFEARIIPARNNEVVAMIRDVTERKKAEDDLKRLTHEYETILNHLQSADFFLNVDEHGVFTFERLNACHERLTGLKTKDVRGRTPVQVLGEKLGAEVENNYRQCLKRRETIKYEELIDLPNGSRSWLTSLTPVIIDGKVEKIVGNSLDITELKSQERKLAFILQAAKNVSFVLTRYSTENNDVLIEEFSPGAENIFGYRKEEVLGRPVSMLHTEQDATIFPDIYDRILKGETWHGKSKLLRKNGEIFPALVAVHPFKEYQENCALGVSIDISELEKTQQELLQAKESAESANRAKSEFLANMSHEIRTPLNGIMGMMQLLQTTSLSMEQKEYVDLSIKSAKRLTRLLSDILDLSRVEAEKMTIQEEEFSLRDLNDSVNDLFSIAANKKGISLNLSIDHDLPETVIGDSSRVSQIMFNLVGNAIKFSDHGTVSMDIMPIPPGKHSDIRIMFTVSDSGIGIPEDKMRNLLKPFVQVEDSYTRKYEGAGLGLAIVKRLVDLMGGTINITSQVGEGTSIYVVLPFKLPEGVSVPKNNHTGTFSESEKSLRILLAEDDPTNQYTTQKILEMMGHTVSLAENGQQVLDLLNAQDFDVILMDIRMPVMDGVEATRIIRSSTDPGIKKDIPIIALTAYAMQGDREKYLEAGMNDYLAKPVELKSLEKAFSRLAE